MKFRTSSVYRLLMLSGLILLSTPGYSKADTFEVNGLTVEKTAAGSYKLTEIDRSRIYNVLDLGKLQCDDGSFISINELSNSPSAIELNGKKEDKYLFEDVQVTHLIIPETLKKINAKSFHNIEGLEQLTFTGPSIPKIEEGAKWFGLTKDDNWRSKIKCITFKGLIDSEGIESIISGTPRIALGENASFPDSILKDRSQNRAKARTLFAPAGNLKKMDIPFRLAADANIPWPDLIMGSALNGQEVYSLPGEPTADNDSLDKNDERRTLSKVCAVSLNKSGETSNNITHIRIDALNNNDKLMLPTMFCDFICGDKRLIESKIRHIFLKRDTVQFYPEIDNIRNANKTKTLFPSSFGTAHLTITSPYADLRARTRICEGSFSGQYPAGQKVPLQPTATGNTYRLNLPMAMDQTYQLELELDIGRKGSCLPVKIDRGVFSEKPITFSTPKQRRWILDFCLWSAGLLLGIPLIMIFLYRFLRRTWAGETLATPYMEAEWWQHALFSLASLLLAGSIVGIVGDTAAVYLWYPVMTYLNASFLSSLLISISTTLLQIVLGLLKGISLTPFVAEISLEHVIEPVTDMLARISWVSWISSAVLAFVRMLSELIRQCSHLLWPLVGISAMTWLLPGHRQLREYRWIRGSVSLIVLLTVALPVLLLSCSWISSEFMAIAGTAFDDSINSFRALASGFSWNAFLSVSAIGDLLSLLTDALTQMLSASMMYIAIKLFDCFAVPLGLLKLGLTVLQKFGYAKDIELIKILKKYTPFSNSAQTVPVAVPPASFDPKTLPPPLPAGASIRTPYDEEAEEPATVPADFGAQPAETVTQPAEEETK